MKSQGPQVNRYVKPSSKAKWVSEQDKHESVAFFMFFDGWSFYLGVFYMKSKFLILQHTSFSEE
jgi:hypothetical protein